MSQRRPDSEHKTTRERYTGAGSRNSSTCWNPEAAIRALVFDFDGLILDTETAEHQACQEIYLEHGAELSLEHWLGAIGTSAPFAPFALIDQMEHQLGELLDREAIHARQRARTAEILDGRSILPGVLQFIDQALSRGMDLAVTSSSSREWVDGHLERLELRRHFAVIRSADDVERPKPDPALHLAVLEALGVRAREAIAIEDSPRGIEAAKAAGLYCVSVPNALTRSLSMDAADLALLSLASTDLDEIVERARRRGDV